MERPGILGNLVAAEGLQQLAGEEGWSQGVVGPHGLEGSATKLCSLPSSREPQGTPNNNLWPRKYYPGQIAVHSADTSHKPSPTS